MSIAPKDLFALAQAMGLKGYETSGAHETSDAGATAPERREKPETAMAVAMRLALPGFTEPNR